jgi:small subunit ribosomal protein S8e
MSVTHSSERKKKKSGGRRIVKKGKKKSELGSLPTLTTISEKEKIEGHSQKGGIKKIKVKKALYANVLDRETKKYSKVKLLTEKENPANRNYARRNILTKGSMVDTELGLIRVTSRPGQHGTINAVLVEKKQSERLPDSK